MQQACTQLDLSTANYRLGRVAGGLTLSSELLATDGFLEEGQLLLSVLYQMGGSLGANGPD